MSPLDTRAALKSSAGRGGKSRGGGRPINADERSMVAEFKDIDKSKGGGGGRNTPPRPREDIGGTRAAAKSIFGRGATKAPGKSKPGGGARPKTEG